MPTFREHVESSRPPDASKRETKALFLTALRFRDQLADCLNGIESDAFFLDEDELDNLAVALAELAEDLHANAGIWRALEAYHQEFFGVPLPLLSKHGDLALETFDARRFQFFLYSVWRHFHPDRIVSPEHRGFLAIARLASEYFAGAFATQPRQSAVADFLAKPNQRGWEVKRKLVWLGTRSFLFRFAFHDYMSRQEIEQGGGINATDDFLCQQCTEWSGLGALDILAAALDLPNTDRLVLRGWYERHTAFYRIESLNIQGEVEALDAVNLINDQRYRIRVELKRKGCIFHAGQMVFGSLVPWRDEWYWSGTQRTWKNPPEDFSSIKREFREKHYSIAYRYCPDLAQRAREFAEEHLTDFVQFHGSDFTLFPDGLSATAAEQKRLRIFSEVKAGKDLERILEKYGLKRAAQAVRLPREFIEGEEAVAVFYHKGEGTELLTGYGTLLSGLKKRTGSLTQDERGILQAFVEEDTISPAFVRRVIRDAGSAGIERLYFLPDSAGSLEYLLRRFKGCYYRKRYPCISLHE